MRIELETVCKHFAQLLDCEGRDGVLCTRYLAQRRPIHILLNE